MHKLIWTAALAAACCTPLQAAVITVDDTAGNLVVTNGLCSLQEAVNNANLDAATGSDCAAGSGADIIAFSGVSSIALITLLDVRSPITISGPITLTGFGSDPLQYFSIGPNGQLTLDQVNPGSTTGDPTGGGNSPGTPPGTGRVPEPPALALTGLALLGLAAARRRARAAVSPR